MASSALATNPTQKLPNELLFEIYKRYIDCFRRAILTFPEISEHHYRRVLKPCLVNKAIWNEVQEYIAEHAAFVEYFHLYVEREIDRIPPLYLRPAIKNFFMIFDAAPGDFGVYFDRELNRHFRVVNGGLQNLESVQLWIANTLTDEELQGVFRTAQAAVSLFAKIVKAMRNRFEERTIKAIKIAGPSGAREGQSADMRGYSDEDREKRSFGTRIRARFLTSERFNWTQQWDREARGIRLNSLLI